jgi:hypothetical protein
MLTIAYSCSDDTVTPVSKNIISGRISFVNVDTSVIKNLTKDSSYFAVSIFGNWPPTGNANATQKIQLKNESGNWVADYSITAPNDGQYVVTSAWIKVPYTVGNSVFGLGTYHSDTSHSPAEVFSTTGKRANIVNGTSVGNINFLSWADTATGKRIYKF